MHVVVADTGPLHYLVLIDAIDLIPKLFDQVLVPQTVHDELTAQRTPEPVRSWIAHVPPWLKIHPDPARDFADDMTALDAGEQMAIALALAVKADLVLMDDQAGIATARRMGLAAVGTLGVLDLAARHGLIDLAEAFTRLKATNFYYRQGLLDVLLARHKGKS